MQVFNFDFKNTYYLGLRNTQFIYDGFNSVYGAIKYMPVDTSEEYTVISNTPFYPFTKDYTGDLLYTFPLIIQDLYYYDFSDSSWKQFTETNDALFDLNIVGTDYKVGFVTNRGKVLKINGYISFIWNGTSFNGYMLNDLEYRKVSEGFPEKDFSNLQYWNQQFVETSDYYSECVSKYEIYLFNYETSTKTYLNLETYGSNFSLLNNQLKINIDKDNSVHILPLNFLILPESFSIDRIVLDYFIENQTANNSIGFRIVDEEGREWMYSVSYNEWQYVGQVSSEFPAGTTIYQSLETLNRYIGTFTESNKIKIKMKVISDDNNIFINRVSVFYTDNSEEESVAKVNVYGNIRDIIGEIQEGVMVQVMPRIPQGNYSLGRVYSGIGSITTTDENGNFVVSVDANTTIVVNIPICGLRTQIEVGYEDVNLAEYIESRY